MTVHTFVFNKLSYEYFLSKQMAYLKTNQRLRASINSQKCLLTLIDYTGTILLKKLYAKGVFSKMCGCKQTSIGIS